jgi:hypothetical protein
MIVASLEPSSQFVTTLTRQGVPAAKLFLLRREPVPETRRSRAMPERVRNGKHR